MSRVGRDGHCIAKLCNRLACEESPAMWSLGLSSIIHHIGEISSKTLKPCNLLFTRME